MTRVIMSGCKSSINGNCLSCYRSLIFSLSFLAFEVLKKSWGTSKGTSKIATVIDIYVYTAKLKSIFLILKKQSKYVRYASDQLFTMNLRCVYTCHYNVICKPNLYNLQYKTRWSRLRYHWGRVKFIRRWSRK